MFARKLIASFALLALSAIGYGASAWWIATEAEHRVLRGRVAGDLYRVAVVLEVEAATLRSMITIDLADGADRGLDPTPVLAPLAAKHAVARALAERARLMDAARGKPMREHEARDRLLDDIAGGLDRLRRDLLEAPRSGLDSPLSQVGRRLEPDGRIAGATAALVDAERAAMHRERTMADGGLADVRWVALAATSGFCAIAFALAFFLYRLMRRPLAELTAGLCAFEAERLEYRIPQLRRDEFGLLAASANRMAERLHASRLAEASLRRSLERRVVDRTARLAHAVADLENADRRRQQLIADIGHELRTPATVIRGEAEVALRCRDWDPDRYRDALARIVDGGRQLSRVIDDLLTLARDDDRALRIDALPLDANALVQRMTPTAGSTGMRVETEIAPGEAVVLADELRLRQVVGILLDNAVRYSRADDAIRIRAGIENGEWRLEVRDRGIGIDAEERQRVFQRGFRGRAARRVRAGGSGLGLPIARALVERHRGRLTIESDGAGCGTTAVVTLPLADMSIARVADHQKEES